MSSWRNAATWAALVDGSTCPICQGAPSWSPVATLEACLVMAEPRGPMRGYCWLPLKRHAVELHELTAAEAAAYMRDLQRVGRAVQAITGAVKLNWELHGNTVPHLHAHLFPRYVGDRFEGRPIDPRSVTEPVYGPGEFETFVAQLRSRLTGPES